MRLDRRSALIGGAAAAAGLAAPRIARAETAERVFRIVRDGSDIGEHVIAASRTGDACEVSIDIAIAVKVLGITAYRYEMVNNERWRGGRLVSLDSRVNDDGEQRETRATRRGDGLVVEGPDFSGPAPLDAATTIYLTRAFLDRDDWIATDGGELYDVRVDDLGAQGADAAYGGVPCTRYRVTNGDEYTVELEYDDRGEWVGLAFDASGEPATYRAESVGARLAALWAG